jgi:hypothetical protein
MRSTFGASIDSVIGRLNDLKEKIGESFTKNNFFLEGSKLLENVFISWGNEIDANSEAWRRWSKGASLAVMEFVADTGEGVNSTYKTFQRLTGVLELSFAGAAKLGQAWQFLFEAVNRLSGNNEKAAEWALAQQYNAEAIEGAYQRASEAFDNADQGMPNLTKATERIRQLKDELADIEPSLNDVAANVTEAAEKNTEELDDRIVQLEGTWTNVYTTAKKEQSEFFKQALRDIERLQAEAAKVKIGSGSSANLQGFAQGGPIRPFSGGLGGYGGGDRRLILVEDGEHVIRKEAVARLGHGFFQKFNRLQFPSLPKFATGGAYRIPVLWRHGWRAGSDSQV